MRATSATPTCFLASRASFSKAREDRLRRAARSSKSSAAPSSDRFSCLRPRRFLHRRSSSIVEFYHAGLDHYFITANPKEISDLDSGVHAGWQRTGESFSAYGVGSSGRTGRRPVCRVYGNPAAGLDSHFYSASPQECVATLENFGDDWLYEAAEVFEMELPDTTTGACAFDRIPIYRLWNGRADSSHRFVKTLALRAQMIARGFISEGYGPNGVVFCALT